MSPLEKKAIEKRDDRYRRVGTLTEIHRDSRVREWIQAPSLSNVPFQVISFDGDPAFAWIRTETGARLTLTPEECSRKIFSFFLKKKKVKLSAWIKIPGEEKTCRVQYSRDGEFPWREEAGPIGWHRLEAKDIELETYE